jgi:hypothetical protein
MYVVGVRSPALLGWYGRGRRLGFYRPNQAIGRGIYPGRSTFAGLRGFRLGQDDGSAPIIPPFPPTSYTPPPDISVSPALPTSIQIPGAPPVDSTGMPIIYAPGVQGVLPGAGTSPVIGTPTQQVQGILAAQGITNPSTAQINSAIAMLAASGPNVLGVNPITGAIAGSTGAATLFAKSPTSGIAAPAGFAYNAAGQLVPATSLASTMPSWLLPVGLGVLAFALLSGGRR